MAFIDGADPMVPRLDAAGLRSDLPLFGPVLTPEGPGLDPDRPPKLR